MVIFECGNGFADGFVTKSPFCVCVFIVLSFRGGSCEVRLLTTSVEAVGTQGWRRVAVGQGPCPASGQARGARAADQLPADTWASPSVQPPPPNRRADRLTDALIHCSPHSVAKGINKLVQPDNGKLFSHREVSY